MAKIKRAKYFTHNFSTYTIYGRVVRTAKIKLHENLSHEIFLTRKFRNLRYNKFSDFESRDRDIKFFESHLQERGIVQLSPSFPGRCS